MKKYLSLGLLVAATTCARAQSTSGTITKIPDQVHRRAVQALVKITVGDRQRFGTGIIIGKTRNGAPIILTANALIAGFETQLSVQLENQTEPVPAQMIKPQWRNRDLVLLATRANLPGAPALAFGRSDQIVVGETVAVLGFPGTSFISQNSGEVVRTAADRLTLNFVFEPGQEGAPVIDKDGRVLGIALSSSNERGMVVPIDLARIFVDECLRSATLAEFWHENKVTKKWYGWVLGVLLITAAGIGIGFSGVL